MMLLRRLLADTVYTLTAFVLAVPAFCLVITGIAAGLGTMVISGLGLAILVGTGYVARGFAVVERLRLRSMLELPAAQPSYLRAQEGDGRIRAFLTPLRDVQTWLDLLWCLVGLVTGTIAFVIAVAWWAATLGGLSYWFWQRYITFDEDSQGLAEILGLGDTRRAESLLNLGFGVVALLTLPLVIHLLARGHAAVSQVLLSSRGELLERVEQVEASRESAHRAEAQSLRRLERDIHDGPQQRLIRLGMDLGRARHQLSDDPAKAAATLDAAVAQNREAIEELRALSRGIAPPLLVDRGLAAAVLDMASGQPIPVATEVEVPDDLPLATQTAAYFVVAEALTNVVRHAEASRARVAIGVDGAGLVITIDDDGRGGARPTPGRGLDGLGERLAGVSGTLDVASPEGGPTRLRAEIPLG